MYVVEEETTNLFSEHIKLLLVFRQILMKGRFFVRSKSIWLDRFDSLNIFFPDIFVLFPLGTSPGFFSINFDSGIYNLQNVKKSEIFFPVCICLIHSLSLFLSLFLSLRFRLAVFVCSSLLLVQIIHTWVICMPHPVHNGNFQICCLKCIWYNKETIKNKKSKATH